MGLPAKKSDFLSGIRKAGGEPVESPASFTTLFMIFDEYFRGKAVEFNVPLSLKGSSFDLAVWKALQKIPWGSALSYGEVAASIGRPQAARAVGGACGRNPVPIIIPCHRVLASNALVGGFSGGINIKKALLGLEGIAFIEP